MSDVHAQLFSRYGKKIPANTVLFQEGDAGENMYIIQSGRVKISKRIRGAEETLATLEKGEFLGEMAILNDKPRSATAETLDACDMLVIDRTTFDTLIRGDAEIAVRFIRRLADRLREANDQMASLMSRDNTGRLVSILAKQVREQKEGGEFVTTIEDLAGLTGIEGSQARTILGKLSSAGIIEVAGDRVRIADQNQIDRLLRYLEMREPFGEAMEGEVQRSELT